MTRAPLSWNDPARLVAAMERQRYAAAMERSGRQPKKSALRRLRQTVYTTSELLQAGVGRHPDGSLNASELARRVESVTARMGCRVGCEAARKTITAADAVVEALGDDARR